MQNEIFIFINIFEQNSTQMPNFVATAVVAAEDALFTYLLFSTHKKSIQKAHCWPWPTCSFSI
jgi:alkanesulfonate monooxygenase SsuD/methylene tetrahydromethanopterin reductase-like flavin-dependent oxidoreductase (luciferase family)